MHDSTQPSQLTAGTWRLDLKNSAIEFRVRSAIPARGRFTDARAVLVVDPATGNDVSASILVGSLTTGLGLRDKHLKSSHFLDADQHPEMAFEGRLVQTDRTARITGTFTLRGVERPVELTGDIEAGPDPQDSIRLRVSSELNRRDFGVAWMAFDRFMIGSRIRLNLDVVARKS